MGLDSSLVQLSLKWLHAGIKVNRACHAEAPRSIWGGVLPALDPSAWKAAG